jgi:shikimate dehydrogenase
MKACVIGNPINHSLSPTIHNFFLKKYGIDGSYVAIQIKKDELKTEVQKLVDSGFSGFNVTIPHKEEIFKICDHLSKSAKLTGAVNTVFITKDKKLFGHNSDIDGFLNNLKETRPEFDLKNKTVFLIGAGGAARAIVYGLLKSNVRKIFITNRSEIRAMELIKNFTDFAREKNCEINFCDEKTFANQLDECDLLINSTSLGMAKQEALRIDLKNLKKSAIVYDIVYKPLMTELLNQAQNQGNKIVTGIGMLVHQALIGFELWFKEKPQPEEELTEILTEISSK